MKRYNIPSTYIRICMMFFLLFDFVDSVYSKSFKIAEESNRTSALLVSDSVRIEQQSDSISVFATSSCVNTFENQTVSSRLSVQGCNILTLQNVTVSSNGDLTLSAPDAILINGLFEVKLGGLLNIKSELTQWTFDYGYDNSGNRKMRSANFVKLSDVD
ncbi:hypothetical protein [Parabacteroides faecis]|uniref:Auto-transporter adhesin head GIN domain-containing protein n=1 Tax=Parabacteroides faecis TaxID=1217282 RepID=A0ABR6KMM8_9BACT|nr:hypothetical protein [Parabacteroides faecis]MBB4622745.1 hypothetical protein [Parabacteroides faecis]